MSDFNAAASALFGDSALIYQRPIQDLLPFIPETRAGAGQTMTWQGQIIDRTGRTLDLEISQTHLVKGLLPTSIVYVVHDLSRRGEANRLAEQLLYSVAHQLSGPLTTLRSALDILSTGFGELAAHDLDHLLKGACRTSTRLAILVEDWLSAGTIRSGRLRIHRRSTQLSAVIEEALDIVHPILEARGQFVEQDIPSSDLRVLADPRSLRQVLSNLLDNAAKYSPEGEIIRIRARKSDGHIQVTVEDHGPGIPSGQRAAVFEWFYRSAPDISASGTGLGLAIAKAIVEAHGGTIAIKEGSVTGTEIYFSLPGAEASRER